MHAHTDNFDANQLIWSMKSMSRPAPGVERRFVLHIKLDNFFDRNLTQLIQLITGKAVRFNKAGTCRQDPDMDWYASDKHFEIDYRIEYDPKSFDVHFWHHAMARYFGGWQCEELDKIKRAFQEEVDRHHERAKLRKRKAGSTVSRPGKRRAA
ncbi:hypothetical protein EJ03DRAFT_1925 [Teratosphaeria nubilosa]|uniref:Uncharacterized protein n=1 Tax=Teratosphaeria nubilosa TaxID=161662 RepID=A0A6G1LP16_9PEZI|nr:hypothetical protein EJ03DRAFT_1925 [Teratosphaeria nubilosa]